MGDCGLAIRGTDVGRSDSRNVDREVSSTKYGPTVRQSDGPAMATRGGAVL